MTRLFNNIYCNRFQRWLQGQALYSSRIKPRTTKTHTKLADMLASQLIAAGVAAAVPPRLPPSALHRPRRHSPPAALPAAAAAV